MGPQRAPFGGAAGSGSRVEVVRINAGPRFLIKYTARRLSASTVSSYRKNIRLHIDPYLGEKTLARLTGGAVDAWMRTLEASVRVDGRGGLSAHANAMITPTVYQHVHPGMGRQAADRFAALLRG